MSVYVSGMVWKHSRATGVAFTVLLAIADKCDDEGVAHPRFDTSMKTLAKMARCKERAAQYAVKELIELGELSRQVHNGVTSNTFQVHLDRNYSLFDGPPAPVDKSAPPVHGGAGEGRTVVREPVHGDAPNPSSVVVRHVSGSTAPKKEAAPQQLPAAIAAFIARGITEEHRGWARAKGFDKYLDLHWEQLCDYLRQQRNWKRYTDFDAAFRSCVRDDWGDIRMKGERSARFSGAAPGGAAASSSPFSTTGKTCSYCPQPARGGVSGRWHCGDAVHSDWAMEGRKPSNPPPPQEARP